MIIIFFILFIVESKLIAPKKVIQAIDCGGWIELRTSLGIKFKPDSNYTGISKPVDYLKEPNYARPRIRYTEDYLIYMTQRQGSGGFGYRLFIADDLPKFQKYVLILKFAELHYNSTNKRVFDIALGNKIVVSELDVYSKVGEKTAHDEYIEFTIDEGILYRQGQKYEDALNINNELIIEFLPIIDSPMISGMFLFKGSLEETDFYDKEQMKIRWDEQNKEMTQEEKRKLKVKQSEQWEKEIKEKKEKIKIRPGFTSQIEMEAAKPYEFQWPDMRFDLFLYMLQTPLGAIMIVSFLVVLFVTISFAFFDPYGQKEIMKNQQIKKKKVSFKSQ